MVGCCTSLFGNTPQDKAVVPLMSRDRVFPLTSTCVTQVTRKPRDETNIVKLCVEKQLL